VSRTLFFPYVPRDVELAKSQSPTRAAITGASVYAGEVLKALLRHGTYEHILLPETPLPPDGDLRESALFQRHADRLRFVPEHALPLRDPSEQLVFFTPGPHVHNLLRARQAHGRNAPITGVIHSLNHSSQMRAVADLLLSPLQPYDAVVCSSTSGQRAFRSLIETMACRLRKVGFKEAGSPVQLPVIPLGVDSSDFDEPSLRPGARAGLGVDGDECVLLYLGRFADTSKADLFPLLLVFSRLVPRHPGARLILAGDDTYHQLARGLEAFARALGCADRVRLLPNPSQAEKRGLYAAADLFVSPADSLQETFGITILEAMSAGLPVVASDWDGYRDLVEPGVTGFLVPTTMPSYPGHLEYLRSSGSMNSLDLLAATTIVDVAALEQALAALITDREARLRLGEEARLRAQARFDWAVVVRRYEALWEQLAQMGRATAAEDHILAPNLESYDYLEVFGHYASQVLDASRRLRLSETGRSLPALPALLDRVAFPNSWFGEPRLLGILRYCAARPDASVAEIMAGCSPPGEPEVYCLSSVCRLYKYGLLETSP
jgi:glycosyltransferase involved in cell wall biosynthesis